MPFCEQLIYGVDGRQDPPVKAVLGQSPGVSQEAADELVRLCRSWGDTPPLGLQRPALMSFPLATGLSALRGRLYAVIRASQGDQTLFHAVVVNDQAYAAFGRNPFALAEAATFLDAWAPGTALGRIELPAPGDILLPTPGTQDVGLVDEAVVQIELEGRLVLPLEQALADSDRALALIIAALPEQRRKDLRFASFTTSEANAYHLAALSTEGSAFAGWQRVLLAMPSMDLPPALEAHRETVARHLAAGDLAGLAAAGRRPAVSAERTAPPPPELARRTEPPRGDEPPRRVEPTREQAADPPRRPAAAPPPAASALGESTAPPSAPTAAPRRAGFQSAVAGPAAYHSGLSPSPRPASSPHSGPSSRSSPSASRTVREWRRTPVRIGLPGQKRSAGGGFLRFLAVIAVLFVAGWAATVRLDLRTVTESLEWAGLPGMSGADRASERAPSLLESVDVAGVYDKQRRRLGRGGLSLGPSPDNARRKALTALREGAAGPLCAQVDLFVSLADQGVQGDARTDRESARLRELARQGALLSTEMARLELGWHSLATGRLWSDLGELDDAGVVARRDSLAAAEQGALADARRGLNVENRAAALERACRHVEGMTAVVNLLAAEAWSDLWERKLQRAAEMVSPAASPATRAYRNSAFALLRLKEAERREDNVALAYAETPAELSWPSAEAAEQVRRLRREAGRFPARRVPPLLAATIELYTSLEEPAVLAADPSRLAALEENAAVRFDPAGYGPFLARLKFDAVAAGSSADRDPAGAAARARFRTEAPDRDDGPGWRLLAADLDDPFLKEWAVRRADAADARALARQSDFTAAWVACRDAVAALRADAAAGRDWSAQWRRADALAREIQNTYLTPPPQDPAGREQVVALGRLAAALGAPLPVEVASVTVRLDADALREPARVRFELTSGPGGETLLSDEFTIGPAAPAGSGWVGTCAPGWTLALGCRQHLTGRVVAADGQTVLEVGAQSLAAGEGPAAWATPRRGETGSLTLRLGAGFWEALQLPAEGTPF